MALAITATTRSPRKGERDGLDYYFHSPEQFEKQIQEKKLLEYAQVHGHYYGVPAEPVLKKLKQGTCVILNIDVQGMQTVKKKLGAEKILSFFLLPPSPEILEMRLRQRMTNTEEQIQYRLKQGQLEMQKVKDYDHVIVNDSLAETIEKFSEILKQERIIS